MLPPLHHIGYVVDDLHRDVPRFAAATGAGPFFALEHIAFDEVTFQGEPASYDHSSAFGAWGDIIVELSQVHHAEPAEFLARLTAPGKGTGHIAWLAPSLPDEVTRLEALGMRAFHAGRAGPASAIWLDGAPFFGHPVEVLQRREELLGFYAMIKDAAIGWDGSDPLRIMTGPPVAGGTA